MRKFAISKNWVGNLQIRKILMTNLKFSLFIILTESRTKTRSLGFDSEVSLTLGLITTKKMPTKRTAYSETRKNVATTSSTASNPSVRPCIIVQDPSGPSRDAKTPTNVHRWRKEIFSPEHHHRLPNRDLSHKHTHGSRTADVPSPQATAGDIWCLMQNKSQQNHDWTSHIRKNRHNISTSVWANQNKSIHIHAHAHARSRKCEYPQYSSANQSQHHQSRSQANNQKRTQMS